ncbi:MAG: TonB-dependent receptor, partial [Dolichospermum sp.]
MNRKFFVLPVSLLSLLAAFPSIAADNEDNKNAVKSDIPNLNEIELPSTNAELLTQQPEENEVKTEPNSAGDLTPTNDPDI